MPVLFALKVLARNLLTEGLQRIVFLHHLYISGETYGLKSIPNDSFFEKLFFYLLFQSPNKYLLLYIHQTKKKKKDKDNKESKKY